MNFAEYLYSHYEKGVFYNYSPILYEVPDLCFTLFDVMKDSFIHVIFKDYDSARNALNTLNSYYGFHYKIVEFSRKECPF